MLGGDIVKMKSGHPTKGSYWFPAYNSTEGVKAMNFIKQQVDAGIKPQKNHFWGLEFLDRKFAIMIEGSWLPLTFLQRQSEKSFEDRVGFIPMLPVPYKNNMTSTLIGGYALGIPKASTNKDLASIPEYPQIADNIRQASYEVQFENKDPNQVLADAASKSAKVLGW